MTLIHKARGYEFWLHYDRTAKVYELFLSEDATDYIGCFDTKAEARAYIQTYLAEAFA
jgi:hypothetical protein